MEAGFHGRGECSGSEGSLWDRKSVVSEAAKPLLSVSLSFPVSLLHPPPLSLILFIHSFSFPPHSLPSFLVLAFSPFLTPSHILILSLLSSFPCLLGTFLLLAFLLLCLNLSRLWLQHLGFSRKGKSSVIPRATRTQNILAELWGGWTQAGVGGERSQELPGDDFLLCLKGPGVLLTLEALRGSWWFE